MRRKYCIFWAVMACVLTIAGHAWGDVAIDEANFPDNVVRDTVRGFDTDNNGVLNAAEIAEVIELHIAGMGISSLKGIENFTALEVLECHDNKLSVLDVSRCKALKYLKCNNNQLASLNINGCKALEILNCLRNKLTSLDVSSCTALFRLHCEENQLTELDARKCKALMGLSCLNNRLTSLKVSGCTSLAELYCNNNQLTALDLSGCTSLMEFYCNNNQLTALDITVCTALIELDCHENRISSLNLSGCKSLMGLYCYRNQIATLDLSKCVALGVLECGENRLATLNASKCTSLRVLECAGNQLTALNISGCTVLTELNCRGNQLAALDLSKCTALMELNCRDNPMTSLNVSGCTSLRKLNCKNNQLSILDLSNKTSLEYLNCRSNGLKTLNISGCSALAGLICYSNQITAIDISSCPENIAVACDKDVNLVNTPTILTDTIPATTRRASYSFKISGMGGKNLTWSVSNGSLPDGLTLKASSGKITGTATKAGTFTFTVQLKDNTGRTATKEFTLKVTQTTVSGTIPATTTRRDSYTGTPQASGGKSPYTWSVSSGKLPDGLKLNSSNGKITGSPTKAGTFTFTIKAKDANGAAGTKAYTIKVTQTKVSGTIPATITRKASCSWTPKASNGASPYTWSVSSGKLPDGLTLNASTGAITGSPTKAGTFTFTLKAKDSNGAAGTKAYTVTVTQTTVTGTIPATGTVGSSFTFSPKASGGEAPYTWSVSSGKIPNGLTLNTSTGKITGTFTKSGTFTFTLKAKDSNGAAGTKNYTVKVTATSSAKPLQPDTSGDMPAELTAGLPQVQDIPGVPGGIPETDGTGKAVLPASLGVKSDDVLGSGEGQESDLITVKAGKTLTFILGKWSVEVSGVTVWIDDKPAEGITISDDGTFTLKAELVTGDFKVCVKATHNGSELESGTLYIIAE